MKLAQYESEEVRKGLWCGEGFVWDQQQLRGWQTPQKSLLKDKEKTENCGVLEGWGRSSAGRLKKISNLWS